MLFRTVLLPGDFFKCKGKVVYVRPWNSKNTEEKEKEMKEKNAIKKGFDSMDFLFLRSTF